MPKRAELSHPKGLNDWNTLANVEHLERFELNPS
jgi:hypothetical protein